MYMDMDMDMEIDEPFVESEFISWKQSLEPWYTQDVFQQEKKQHSNGGKNDPICVSEFS